MGLKSVQPLGEASRNFSEGKHLHVGDMVIPKLLSFMTANHIHSQALESTGLGGRHWKHPSGNGDILLLCSNGERGRYSRDMMIPTCIRDKA